MIYYFLWRGIHGTRKTQMFASDKYFEENKYNHDFRETDLKIIHWNRINPFCKI